MKDAERFHIDAIERYRGYGKATVNAENDDDNNPGISNSYKPDSNEIDGSSGGHYCPHP